jgi:hypothetical protein
MIDKSAEGEQDCVSQFRAFPSDKVCPLEVTHETHPHLSFDSVCVLRVRTMGAATCGQMQQQLDLDTSFCWGRLNYSPPDPSTR